MQKQMIFWRKFGEKFDRKIKQQHIYVPEEIRRDRANAEYATSQHKIKPIFV